MRIGEHPPPIKVIFKKSVIQRDDPAPVNDQVVENENLSKVTVPDVPVNNEEPTVAVNVPEVETPVMRKKVSKEEIYAEVREEIKKSQREKLEAAKPTTGTSSGLFDGSSIKLFLSKTTGFLGHRRK